MKEKFGATEIFFFLLFFSYDSRKKHPIRCLRSISLISALSRAFSFHWKPTKTRIWHTCASSLEHVTTVFNIHEHSRRWQLWQMFSSQEWNCLISFCSHACTADCVLMVLNIFVPSTWCFLSVLCSCLLQWMSALVSSPACILFCFAMVSFALL